MTSGLAGRLAKTLSFMFLVGALITGIMAITQIAHAQHGTAAVAARHSAIRITSRSMSGSRKSATRQTRKTAASAHSIPRTYRVHSGDTLSSISKRCYGTAGDWPALYHANASEIANPDMIYPGQVLAVPAHPGAARQATTAAAVVAASSGQDRRATHEPSASAALPRDGVYECAGLEALWDRAGGNPSSARMAAEIALAESGGDPSAVSPTDDYGLWQINASNGNLATLDPEANAHSAVVLSHDGTDWSAWTTYREGLFWGRC